jgi:hypothetical protein
MMLRQKKNKEDKSRSREAEKQGSREVDFLRGSEIEKLRRYMHILHIPMLGFLLEKYSLKNQLVH